MMKALRFHYNLPSVAFTRILGGMWKQAYVSPLAPVRMVTIPRPELPRPDWVRIRTRRVGICGSDLKQVVLKGNQDNPLTALITFPHVLGHEAVGVIEAVGSEVKHRQVGERVVINPWLSCLPRGIEPPCPPCQAGDYSLCRNFTRGNIPTSMHLGNNAEIPGAYAEAFVCHESQAFPIADSVPDEVAVMADPFSVSLHSILRNPPPPDAPALVYGVGMLGLCAVAILRKLFPKVTVFAIGRYPHQLRFARELGAHLVLAGKPKELILRVAEAIGVQPLWPWSGMPWLQDGVGVVYDTVGSPESIETSVRLARQRSRLVISGVEAPKRFEWTPLYFKEMHMIGSNAFGFEPYRGESRHAMDIYLELAQEGLDLSHLITHRFAFHDWRKGFLALMDKRASGAVKVLLEFD